MGCAQTPDRSPPSLLRRLLACFSLAWLVDLLQLFQSLRPWLAPQPRGLYEILLYDTCLELLDERGERAHVTKQQRVRFLQDYVVAFEDYAWGDGAIFAAYACRPGVVVDRYQEGDRWTVLISLRETKHRGDVEEFYIDRTVLSGFMESAETMQVEIRHPTRHLRLRVLFPGQRRCRRAILMQRSRHRTLPLGPAHFHDLPDGRQLLAWETRHVQALEVYTVKWWW